MFYDLIYSKENDSEKSKINNDEVNFIEKLIEKLVSICAMKKYPNCQNPSKNQKMNAMESLKGCIGIISPYKSQVRALKEKLFKYLKLVYEINAPHSFLEINTVDAFQGREKDVIIFSAVRSNKD